MILGVFLVLIGLPLILGWLIGGRKNAMWRNLGFITVAMGLANVALAL